MSKRKANSESIVRSREGLSEQGVVRTEAPTNLATTIAEIEPTGRTARERVPVIHKSPQSDTCVEGGSQVVPPGCPAGQVGVGSSSLAWVGGHFIPTGVPVGPVEVLPSSVGEGERPAANWFWELLHNAGYDVW